MQRYFFYFIGQNISLESGSFVHRRSRLPEQVPDFRLKIPSLEKFPIKFGTLVTYLYLCQCKHEVLPMSTQLMTEKIAEYFKTQPVLKAWLFGSFARGEETPDSDVDILFVPDMSGHFSLFTLGGMYMDLKELLGREVDLVPEGSLLPFAQETAEHDKQLIYERSN